MRKSVYRTVDTIFNIFKHSTKKRFTEQFEANRATMKAYEDGLGELKRYEVHPGLRRDGKNNLMDFYYDEAQMNKWRDSCLRSQESLRSKVEKFDREVTSAKQKYGTMSPTS